MVYDGHMPKNPYPDMLKLLADEDVSVETPRVGEVDPVSAYLYSPDRDASCSVLDECESDLCTRYDGHVMDGLPHVATLPNGETVAVWG